MRSVELSMTDMLVKDRLGSKPLRGNVFRTPTEAAAQLVGLRTKEVPKRRNRDYRKEYDDYHAKPEQRKRRSERTMGRNKAIKEGRVTKGDGKEIDHKDFNPANNSAANTRVVSRSTNRKRQPAHKGRNK